MCGNDCNIVSNVKATVNAAPAPTVDAKPQGAAPPVQVPNAAAIKAALEDAFEKRMKGGGCDLKKKCECKAKPGSVVVTINHNVPAEPWVNFTLFFPPLPARVAAPDRQHPTYEVKGTYKIQYDAQPGVCEPNMNVQPPED